MSRSTPMAFVLIMGAFAGRAAAQGNMFVGPGSTGQGDVLRGEGIALQGAGLYNLYSAEGEAINANTMINVNEYVYQSIRHEDAEKAKRRAASRARRLANYNQIRDRVEHDPNQNDLMKGSALNALFEQLTGSKIHPSSYRSNSFQLDANIIKRIPFFYGPQQATIAMSRILPEGKWPIALRGPEFDRERRGYKTAIDAVLELQIDGKTSRESLAALDASIRSLFERLDQVIPPEKDALYLEAKNYLRRLDTSKELMKKREIELIMGQIDRYNGTSVHDLVVFMQNHNLRFAVPEIGDERAAYPKLYAAMREQLDELNEALRPGDRPARDQNEESKGGNR